MSPVAFPSFTKPAGFEFEDVLPLLVNTYQRGRLVPFLGAGMSAGRLTLWDDFVKKLEGESGVTSTECEARRVSPDARAQRACTLIQNRYGPDYLLESVRRALKGTEEAVPPQTTRLAAICWPLVVSTNYDDLYYYSCRGGSENPEGEVSVQVLGRSPKDCKLVISSLTGPFDRRYIWHVQGFLGGQFGLDVKEDVPGLRELQEQLVIGHAEYRAVTNRSPHFRRCFGEIFNLRSFLFLGSSLTEEYFLNLFGEALDLCGPSAVPHFAFTKKGNVDAKFLAEQMNITVCEFDQWTDLPKWLQRLKEEIDSPKARNARRSFATRAVPQDGEGDLDIVGSNVMPPAACNEAVAFVAQRSNDLPVLTGQFKNLDASGWLVVTDHVFRYQNTQIYAVTARPTDSEDDHGVYRASLDLLDDLHTTCGGVSMLHLQMSPVGGSVPPVFGFIEAIRTFAAWKRNHPDSKLRLIVHIQSAVEFNLSSERIDVRELLSSELIRFWAVVCADVAKEPVRRILRYPPETKLAVVLRDLGLPSEKGAERWFVSIYPSPRKSPELRTEKTAHELRECRLDHIGVVFGSVLILDYHAPQPGRTFPWAC